MPLRRIIFRSADLASDIAANGLHNPVVLYQGVNGVNRHCEIFLRQSRF